LFFDTASNVNPDIVIFANLNGSRVYNTGSKTCQLEHFIETDLLYFCGALEYSRVRRVDSIDISINLALLGAQGRSKYNCGRVRAAPAECGYVFILIYTLEAGDNDNSAFVQLFADSLGVDALYPRLCVIAVGNHSNLAAGEAYGITAGGVESHGEKRD
jgi:hypothetical protein